MRLSLETEELFDHASFEGQLAPLGIQVAFADEAAAGGEKDVVTGP